MSLGVGGLASPRVAVVTGANKGIGFHIAKQLVGSGRFGAVVLGCRNPLLGEAAAETLGRERPGGNKATAVRSLQCDISDPRSVARFAKDVESAYGRVDVLVNNAGVAFKNADPTPFKEQCGPTLRTNFYGTLDCTRALLPLLRLGEDPRCVNVASMAGRLGQVSPALQARAAAENLTVGDAVNFMREFEDSVGEGTHREKGFGHSNYGMSKLGVQMLTRAFARAEAGKVKFFSCCPGYCDTDMSSHKGPRPPEEGAKNAVMPALDEGVLPNGCYIADLGIAQW